MFQRIILLLALLLCSVVAQAEEPALDLTPAERAWLAENPNPQLAFTDAFEPAVIVAPDGSRSGVLVDLLDLINQRLGTNIGLKIMPRTAYQQQLAAKEIEGIMALAPGAIEAFGLSATRPYLDVYPTIYARHDEFPRFQRLADLRGRRLAIVKGAFFAQKMLEAVGEEIEVVSVDTTLAGLKMVFAGKVDALLGLSLQNYLLAKYALAGVEAASILTDDGFSVAVGIRADSPQMVSILNKGLAMISEWEYAQLYSHWLMATRKLNEDIAFSAEELLWLNNHPTLRVGFPQFPPLSFRSAAGLREGIVADYLALVEQKTGLEIQPVYLPWPEMMQQARTRKIDLFAGIDTPERRTNFEFTTPFFQISYVIINRTEVPFISGLDALTGQRVAVVRNVAIHRMLENDYPELVVVPFDDLSQALRAVSTGKVAAYVGDLMTANYQIRRNALTNLKVAAPASLDKDYLSFATRKDWPQLVAVFNKALQSLTPEEHERIRQKWFKVEFSRQVDWRVVWWWTGGVGGLLLVVVILVASWNRRLKSEVQRQTAEIQQKEERFRALVEQASDSIFLADQQANFRMVNRRACESLGYSREELEQMSAPEIDVGLARKEILALLEQVAEHGERAVFESRQRRRDGSEFDVEVSIGPLQLGKENLFMAISRDISLRKCTEEALLFVSQKGWAEDGESFLPALAGYLGETLSLEYAFVGKLVDEGKRVRTMGLYAHGEVREDIEYDLQDTPCANVMGQQLCSHLTGIQQEFPKDLLLVEMEADSYVGAPLWSSSGEPIGLIAVLGTGPLADQKMTEALLQVVAVRAAHELEKLDDLAEIARYQEDLEELVEERTAALQAAQRKLELALQSAEAGTFFLDVPTDELSWDSRSLEMFGITSVVSYQSWAERVHPDDLAVVEAKLERELATEPVLDLHYRIVRPDGEVRFVWEVAMIIRNERGEVRELSGLHFDETEQVLAEIELKRSKEAAEDANRAKSAFLSNMSHELRTPLTAILGYSQLLQRNEELPESLRKKVETINRSGKHLHELINSVLEVSRIEAGHLDLENSRFSLMALLRDIEEMFRLRVEEKGLRLQFEREAQLPDQIIADQGKLRQILINLLGNAVKFTDSGNIDVAVGIRRQAKNESLQISVKDSGVGIASEELERLFKPFEQATAGKIRGGTGLGLLISREYARLMGGDLVASSEQQRGSTFTFSCRIENENLPAGEEEGPLRLASGIQLCGRSCKLLLVDDIEETRNYLSQLLNTPNLTIIEAGNGAEALEKAAVESPDLIIMDMRMEVMNGYVAIRRLKQGELKQVPVLATSASAFEADRREILATGADAFVRKPFDDQEVLSLVAKLLGAELSYSEEDADAGRDVGVHLDRVSLDSIPGELRTRLKDALTRLDHDQINTLLAVVAKQNVELGERLLRLAQGFRYDALLEILERGES